MTLFRRWQVVEESQAALAWLKEKQELQAQLGKHEDPILVSADIKKKEDTLRRVADPILSEKPPPPPKVQSIRPVRAAAVAAEAMRSRHSPL